MVNKDKLGISINDDMPLNLQKSILKLNESNTFLDNYVKDSTFEDIDNLDFYLENKEIFDELEEITFKLKELY